MKIYLAGPLFNEIEKARNRELRDLVKSLKFKVYLPQEDGGVAFDMIEQGSDVSETRNKIFQNDVEQIKACDAMICILDGRVPDEGVCIELGIAFALGKKCIGYKTDQRSLNVYGDNLMIEGCLQKIAYTKQELKQELAALPLSKNHIPSN